MDTYPDLYVGHRPLYVFCPIAIHNYIDTGLPFAQCMASRCSCRKPPISHTLDAQPKLSLLLLPERSLTRESSPSRDHILPLMCDHPQDSVTLLLSVSCLPFLHMSLQVRPPGSVRDTLPDEPKAIILYIFAFYSDKIKKRSPFILAGLVFCLIGFSINISNASHGVKYFGTFFVVIGSYASFPGVVAW